MQQRKCASDPYILFICPPSIGLYCSPSMLSSSLSRYIVSSQTKPTGQLLFVCKNGGQVYVEFEAMLRIVNKAWEYGAQRQVAECSQTSPPS